MRIVAGTLRGKTIAAPDGMDTRPTTDRVREALFSSLYSLRGGFEDAVVLDAFAGSGALGLEAISRGAARCTFVERDAKAAGVVRGNVKNCGLDAQTAQVVQRDAMKTPLSAPAGQPYDLVFLDPPYAYDAREVLGMVAHMRDEGQLGADTIVAYEHAVAAKEDVAAAAEACGFDVHAVKKYGKTGVTLLLA